MRNLLKRLFKICDKAKGCSWCNSKRGICHICEQITSIVFCQRCSHWFCETCEQKFARRAMNAVHEFLFGRKQLCCGPDEAPF